MVVVGDATSMGNGIADDNYVFTNAIKNISSLNVRSLGILDLTGIAGFTALEVLDCRFNELTYIDVSQNVLLRTLTCAKEIFFNTDMCGYNSKF